MQKIVEITEKKKNKSKYYSIDRYYFFNACVFYVSNKF